jgi:PAS domain S-box-containing protein
MMGSDNSSSMMWNLFNQHTDMGTSHQAVAERRERNREHAKRSRVRKKFILESLQEQVRLLQVENTNLRFLVQEHIPENAMEIFEECCSKNPLFANSEMDKSNSFIFGSSQQDGSRGTELVRSDYSLMSCLTSGQKCFVLSDPKLPDNPIVYATPDFYTMTGYSPREVLGRNCRFLQGPGTDRKAIDVLRKSIQIGADATVCLLNYKADGTPFWNQLFVAALRDSDNCIVNYVRM